VSIITKPKEVIVHDPPTAADIDKATALVRADRDAEKQRADDAKSLQAAADQTQLSRLQSELATATNDREAFKKTADDLANELNATRAQLGPKSELLGLDDAKRWNIVATMSPLPKGNPCIAAVASGAEQSFCVGLSRTNRDRKRRMGAIHHHGARSQPRQEYARYGSGA
jgi:hypothetical protein